MKKVKIGKYSVPKRYVPSQLTQKDVKLQKKYLTRSRKAYLKGTYISRPKLKSFTSKKSSHVQKATHMYGVENMKPTNDSCQGYSRR
jgi:hypothetical protein